MAQLISAKNPTNPHVINPAAEESETALRLLFSVFPVRGWSRCGEPRNRGGGLSVTDFRICAVEYAVRISSECRCTVGISG
jgi:hypothetical protein